MTSAPSITQDEDALDIDIDASDKDEVLAMLNNCDNLHTINTLYSSALETKESAKGLLVPYTKAYFERFYELKKQITYK